MGQVSKNYGLLDDGIRRWCGGCGRAHGAVLLSKYQHQLLERDSSMPTLLHEKRVSLGLHPIVTLQYSSTTLYQVSYHIQYLFFYSDNRILP